LRKNTNLLIGVPGIGILFLKFTEFTNDEKVSRDDYVGIEIHPRAEVVILPPIKGS
jgi:hypothetical protein